MSTKQLAIIDYGMGNLHSVASGIKHVAPEVTVEITADPQVVAGADRVIFPGVGAIRDCMAEIRARGADRMVADAFAAGKPVLGICVGLQALMEYSEENSGVDCLGLLRGRVKRFPSRAQLAAAGAEDAGDIKVPHMGWNEVQQTIDHPLWHNIPQNSRFYFVHSYYVESDYVESFESETGGEQQVAGRCHYGVDFCAAIARGSIFAVQFHPEKSHTDGLQLLKNFIAWDGRL